MGNNGVKWSILLAALTALSCSKQEKEVTIKGHLENLPDGKMALYTRSRQTGKIIPIDTVQTRRGSFLFLIDRTVYPEPINVYLSHAQDGVDMKRIFQYSTNQRHKGRSVSTEGFMLEDGIEINGMLKEDSIRKDLIGVTTDRPILTGKQTLVAYNDTLGFNPLGRPSRLTNVRQIENLIRQHPYSYYYLYGMERRVAEFSDAQFMAIFRCFNPDVQASQTGQKLLAYVNGRATKRLTFATSLVDERGKS